MSLFDKREPTGRWWTDHSLSIVISIILIIQTGFLLWVGHEEWLSQQKDHGTIIVGSVWRQTEFWKWWGYEYIVSLVADTYGVLLIVVLSKFLYERDSSEST